MASSGLAENTRGFNGGFGVFVNERLEVCIHAHDYLNGTFRTIQNDTDRLNISNGYTLQVYRLPRTQAFSIVEIGNQSDLLGKKPASPADEENEKGQGHRTDDNGYPNLKFRPLELLLTWQLSVVTTRK